MKKNKGITLIALVITIIVLLILAGVAIAMLSGENGILRKAAEAKTKTEEAQKEEQSILVDYEIDGYFIEKGYKYKCRYGMITGIDLGDKVKSLKDCLPSGYDIKKEDGSEITDTEGTILTTGMQVTKNGQEIARTVIFGDVDCNGKIELPDATIALYVVKGSMTVKDYSAYAIDVTHDGYTDINDSTILLSAGSGYVSKLGSQDHYVQKIKEIVFFTDEEIIKQLGISDQDKFEKVKKDPLGPCYNVTLNKEYTYQELKSKLENDIEGISVLYCDEDEEEISGDSAEKITAGNYVSITIPYKIQEGNKSYNGEEILIKFN